ncbi:hypothetical protein [Chloroflexus sp.]|uniref:hypothetical protein n=1 Tax=Chloroflexus sp. TaxID=1904827 RepID=UPI002ACDCAFB|nr:hypothetical protein [Chloroflexus sp.]
MIGEIGSELAHNGRRIAAGGNLVPPDERECREIEPLRLPLKQLTQPLDLGRFGRRFVRRRDHHKLRVAGLVQRTGQLFAQQERQPAQSGCSGRLQEVDVDQDTRYGGLSQPFGEGEQVGGAGVRITAQRIGDDRHASLPLKRVIRFF